LQITSLTGTMTLAGKKVEVQAGAFIHLPP
jgi:hypothetical protein